MTSSTKRVQLTTREFGSVPKFDFRYDSSRPVFRLLYTLKGVDYDVLLETTDTVCPVSFFKELGIEPADYAYERV